MAVAALVAVFFSLSVRISAFTCLSSCSARLTCCSLCRLVFYTLQFGFLLLNDEIISFQMLFTCDSFCLSTFHQENIGSKGLHGCHILVIELSALSSFMVHPVEYDMSMIIWFEPSVTDLEALLVFCFRLTVQPMPFVFMQENL